MKSSVTVILDTDIGSDCDDVGALALLLEYAKQKRASILSVIYSSGAVPYGVGVVDAINRYYGFDSIPIGASHDGSIGDIDDKMDAEKLSKDTAAFGNRVIRNADVPEHTELNRKLLSQQPDESVTYITIGHTKALHDLLESSADSHSELNGFDLVTRKIKSWVALGGLCSRTGHYVKDWNFSFNNAAPYTKRLIERFPKPIYFVDGGTNVMTGKALKDTPTGNIVRTAYRDWLWKVEKKTLDDQRPSWDLATVCYAIEGLGNYFDFSGFGHLDIDIEKGCRWRESDTQTNQRFVIQKQGVEIAFSNYLNDMISRHRPNQT